ncbi:MAG TPA: pyridoxine 5'-phosphate synthase [Spirochaetota bacterium]|nr:pyridoxine 5'-phosphate synthase [Spirochaetota bacterium]HOM37900.1 pyridoxine 5'-phosphate synthase [Spirochaetota bacterium]HPQ48704.1 pyridoxine 5'-phosphate synthase [Spirochaetota bacterium]
MKLSVNIDHVATLRQARKGKDPDLLQAAFEVVKAGADGITFHLREDRRHIQDEDVYILKKEIKKPLNFECALNEEIINIVLNIVPEWATIVPERREELTTEGGLDVIGLKDKIMKYLSPLKDKGIKVSLFVEPEKNQIEAAKEIGADAIEIHTGNYANLIDPFKKEEELNKIKESVAFAKKNGLIIHAGHGLNYENTYDIVNIKDIDELSIGHSIISRAVFVGLYTAVKEMINIVKNKKA